MTEKFQPSTIENIDYAVYNWVNDILNIFSNTNEGWKKVPVIFSSPERSWSSRADDSIRDEKFTLKYPIISVSRGDFSKPKGKNAALQGSPLSSNPISLMLPISEELNQEKTSERANADSKRYAGTLNSKKAKTNRKIYNIYSIPVPTFTEIMYTIELISNYQVQMNEMLSPFLKYSRNINGFKLLNNNHSYECFIDENISNNSNLEDFSEQERELKYLIKLNVKGYLNIGDANDKGPSIIRTENRPELVFKAEIIK